MRKGGQPPPHNRSKPTGLVGAIYWGWDQFITVKAPELLIDYEPK